MRRKSVPRFGPSWALFLRTKKDGLAASMNVLTLDYPWPFVIEAESCQPGTMLHYILAWWLWVRGTHARKHFEISLDTPESDVA
jgi:hypothetical protein